MLEKKQKYSHQKWQMGLLSLVFWAGVSVLGLVFDWGTYFANCGHGAAITMATFWGCYILIGLPFDLLGGYVIPVKSGYANVRFVHWLSKWCRGSLLHGLYLWLASLALLRVSTHLGIGGALAFVGVHAILLARFQLFLARLLAPLQLLKVGKLPMKEGHFSKLRIYTVSSEDSAFTGGVAGHPGREHVIIPAHWQTSLPDEIMRTLRARRLATVFSGSRTRGLLVAILWIIASFSLAAILSSHSLATVPGLIQCLFWFSLFISLGHTGLLVITSKKGCLEVDNWTRARGACEFKLQKAISFTNDQQAEQPCCNHFPTKLLSATPSVETRLQHLFLQKANLGAWNAAYTMLYLSWAGLSLVSRASPVNLGRPELWVFLPCD